MVVPHTPQQHCVFQLPMPFAISLKMRCDFGCPISRKRVYIFLFKEELLADDAALDIDEFVESTAEKLHCDRESSWLLALMLYEQ